ncbi:MAG: hypothetical protein LBK61_06030 [Spirochaetaceae bacterium]|nr:hypothetical protein [Spirochaetaceae bacterium]
MSGEVGTGFGIRSSDDGKDDTPNTMARAWDGDRDLTASVTFSYENEAGGAKVKGVGEFADASGSSNGVLKVGTAFGWANFLDKKIVVHAGKDFGGKWGLGELHTNAFDPSVDGVDGARVAFNIVDNLSFGVALPLIQEVSVGQKSGKNQVAILLPFGNFFGNVAVGGLYKTDLFSVSAGIRVHPAVDSKDYGLTNASGGYDKDDLYVDVIGGFAVKPISVLSVGLTARYDSRKYKKDNNITWATPKSDDDPTGDPSSKIGYIRLGLKGAYEDGPLSFALKGEFLAQNETPTGAKKDNYVEYWTPEKPGDAAVKVHGEVAYKFTDTFKGSFNVGSDNIAFFKGNGIYAEASTTFTLGSGEIIFTDKVNKLGAEDIPAATGVEKHSPINNEFKVKFVWKF